MTWKMVFGSVGLVAALAICGPAKAQVGADVKQALVSGGFSAPLDKTSSLVGLGSTECGAHMVDVLFYSNTSAATHPRVVFLDGATYLGSYIVEDKPKVEKRGLEFHYKGKLGNKLTCEKDGKLPESLTLDGEIVVMEK